MYAHGVTYNEEDWLQLSGLQHENKIEYFGAKASYDPNDVLML